MEALYVNLKQDRLSPTGELTRDFRGSFFLCCRNDKVNGKLHLVRTLNSTLSVSPRFDDVTFLVPTVYNRVMFSRANHRETFCNWKRKSSGSCSLISLIFSVFSP